MARPLFILDTGGGGALRARVDASGCIVLPPRSQGAFIVPQGTDLSTLTDEQLAAALYETGDSPICDLGGGEYDVYVLQAPRQSDIPAITLVSSAVIGPYEVGDLPTDAYTPGTYASSAGTIASVGAAWTVNGVAWDEVTALAEGDSVTLVETPVDDSSPPNSRTFNYGPVTVAAAPPFTLPSITSFSVGPQDGGDLPVSVNIVEGSDPPQDLFIVAVPDGAGAPATRVFRLTEATSPQTQSLWTAPRPQRCRWMAPPKTSSFWRQHDLPCSGRSRRSIHSAGREHRLACAPLWRWSRVLVRLDRSQRRHERSRSLV